MTYLPADQVLYRHPCDCPTASRPLGEGEDRVHRFEVDGEPFPWHISEDGITVTRLQDALYRVDVSLIPLLKENLQPVAVRLTQGHPPRLVLGEAIFPWVVSEGGVRITSSRTALTLVTLGFFARDVDTDTRVIDNRDGRAVYDAEGNYWGGQEHHPDMVVAVRDGKPSYQFAPHNHTTEGENARQGGRESDQ